MVTQNIELADAIQALRDELVRAQRSKDGTDILFQIKDIELEVQFQVSKSAGGDAGIKFWLVSLGTKGEYSSTATHTVKLKLQALTPEGGEVSVHDQTIRPD